MTDDVVDLDYQFELLVGGARGNSWINMGELLIPCPHTSKLQKNSNRSSISMKVKETRRFMK